MNRTGWKKNARALGAMALACALWLAGGACRPAAAEAAWDNLFALPSPQATEKAYETEPEEVPAPGDVRIEVVRHEREPGEPRRVLIYHTHTWEAYEPTEEDTYTPTERWRTKDNQHNVVRVGEELARELTALGFEVVHDTTAHEPPNLDTAYTRSLQTLEAYSARGETFDCYIDLHRDAYVESMAGSNSVQDGGKSLPHIMLLIGTGTGTSGGEAFAQKPNWQVNIVLAQKITDALNAQVEGLAYPVKTKTGRFNQHVSEGAVLIEVGNNMNTLREALDAMPYLARAIDEATRP